METDNCQFLGSGALAGSSGSVNLIGGGFKCIRDMKILSMQDWPHTLAKTKFGKSFGLSLKLGVFHTHFSVYNLYIYI